MMQFHLNGFRPGDPQISEADVRHQADGTTDGLPTQIDVLIVGCGPTGLTLAAQGVPITDFGYAAYGVNTVGLTIHAHRDTLASNPDLKVSEQDLKFLKSLRIKIEDDAA